jgi:hypothetical protein
MTGRMSRFSNGNPNLPFKRTPPPMRIHVATILGKVLEINKENVVANLLMDKETAVFETRNFQHDVFALPTAQKDDVFRLTINKGQNKVEFKYDVADRKEAELFNHLNKDSLESAHDFTELIESPVFKPFSAE